jgi:Family of unknown function (DUF6516)
MRKQKAAKRVEVLLEQERFELKAKSGGGVLSYEVWGFQDNSKTVVTRYNLAYINHAMCAIDHGRVLGYDNAHNYHHRHFMGKVSPAEFVSYEDTLEKFQHEWQSLLKAKKGSS